MDSEHIFFGERYKYYISLIVILFLVYFNCLFGAFVWDDVFQIKNNFVIHSISNIPKFFLGSTYAPTGLSGNLVGDWYRPLLTLSFSIIYTLFGAQPLFFYLFQLTIHILNGILLFVFLKKFFKERVAFFLSLLFLVHPINVEAVSYISGLNDPLFFLFGILALILSLNEQISMKRMFVVGFLLLCSLLSKETGILFLIIIFAYRSIFKYKKSDLISTTLLLLVPTLLYFYLRFFVPKISNQGLSDAPITTIPLIERGFTMPAIILFYLNTFFFPKDLFTFQYWIITQPSLQFYLPLIIDSTFLIWIITLGIWIYRRRKAQVSSFLFFTLWLLVGIGLHMQIIPLDMTVSDRWFYFPMVGMLGMLGVFVETIQHPSVRLKNLATVIIITIIAIFSLRTVIQNTYWQDGISLFSYNLQLKSHDSGVENFLALELARAGKLDEAQKLFENLVITYPIESSSIFVTHSERVLFINNLATVDEAKGDVLKAKALYEKILDTDETGDVYFALAVITLQNERKPTEAKKLAQKGLLKYPNDASLWEVIAEADYVLGNRQDALIEIKKAKDISPSPGIIRLYNGMHLFKSGHF